MRLRLISNNEKFKKAMDESKELSGLHTSVCNRILEIGIEDEPDTSLPAIDPDLEKPKGKNGSCGGSNGTYEHPKIKTTQAGN